ncbi:unnamed protein product [Lymnaea stagnalis]|uniref:Uncharacterized protein n=1 Tax=Lymnaea stagnalis TaxID=6523 RepID=A0AAV2HV44_LYMST
MSKLKNIIANQIRGIVRKKHTFPNYKIRFKPFFSPRADLETEVDPQLQVDGNDIGNGVLEVTVLSASRLPFVPPGSRMYCTVCVDSLPWKQLMAERRKNKKIVTLVLVKTPADPALGMVVKDELLPDRLQPVVIIDEVTPNSPAHQAGVHQVGLINKYL